MSASDRDRAEGFLLDHAADHDADRLRLLGREIAVRLDPDGADAREAAALEAAEERARAKTRFTMRTDDDGLAHGRFTIPALHAAMLRKALIALAAPKHVRATEGAGSYDWQTPTPARMGQAFCDYLETYPVDALPKVGGLAATVIAIGDLDDPRRARSRPPSSTPANASHPPSTSASPAQPASPPPGPTLLVRSSPSADATASTPPSNASPPSSSRGTASTPAATPPATSATSTTDDPGRPAAAPTSPTPSSSAPSTTPPPTATTPPTPDGPDAATPDIGSTKAGLAVDDQGA